MRTSTPGSRRISPSGSDSSKRRTPRRARGWPDEHVGGAALGRHARGGLGHVVVLLHDQLRAQDRPRAAAATRAPRAPLRAAASPAGPRRGGRARPPAAAPSATRAAPGAGPTRPGAPAPAPAPPPAAAPRRRAPPRGCRAPPPGVTRRLASTSSATWRSATSRSADRFSTRKKLLSAVGTRSWRIDPALAQPLDQRLGGQVHQHHLVGGGEHLVRERLLHAHAGELRHLVVEALQVLHVDRREHVDPGVQHVVDVLVALGVLEPRRVRVRQLVDQAQLGRAVEDRGQVHLRDPGAPVLHLAARQQLEALRLGRRLGAAVGLEHADHHVPPRRPAPPGPPGACGRSCPPPRPCPGRSCSGLARLAATGCIVAPQAPRRLWTSRSTSLIPMNGAITPPTP